jgi:tape measure domain-containing protein
LRVNTKQYGLSVEETKQILEGTILAVSAFGGSADDVDGAMRAVVQILSKGSVQAEELRGQLGERFPGAVIKFAQANKLSFDELQDRLKEGSIGIKEFVTFAEKNYEDYAAFSEKLATAPEFAGRRLQIALEQISLEIGGLFGPMGANIQDLLTSTINNIAQFIKDNRGYLRQMISDFSSIVGPIAKVFVELMKVIANFSVQVGKIFQGLFAGIRQALGMASIGEAKARLDKAKAATTGKTKPTRNARGGGTTTSAEFIELEAAQRAFSGLGGQAAFNKANAPAQPSDLVFGGPGAGVSMLTGAADKDKEAKKKQQSLESYHSLQDQLAKNFTQDQLDRMEQEYQARANRINSEFDLREARANSFQKEAIRFERQMSDIELKRQKALLDASTEVIRAQGSVAGGAGANLTGGGGFSTAQLQKASSEASKFTGIANMCSESVKAFYKSLGISLPGVTAWADTVRKAGKTMTDWSKLQAGDIVATGRPGDTPHVGVYTGENNVFHQSRKRGLKAGNYPDLDYFKSGYFVRPNAMDAGAPRKVTGDEKRDVIADQKAQLAMAQQSLTIRLADAQAVREAAVAWAQYSASIVPIEEQALQNDILSKKNELVKASLPEDVIEKELKYFEAQQKTSLAMAVNKELLDDGAIDQKEYAKRLLELQMRLAGYNTELDRNIQLQRQQSFDASMGALQKQITMATPVGGTGLAAGFIGDAGSKYEEAIKEGRSQDEAARFAELQNQLTLLETRNGAVKSSVLAIGDAFATAMTTGVSGLIDGTATAQEVFANFLKSVADALMQAAQQMIATYIAIGIAKLFAGLGSSGGAGMNSASALGTNPNVAAYAPLPPIGFAEGGFVAGPTMGLIGEGGESEYVIPSSKMQSAMSRYSRGARGESVIAGSGGGSEGGTATAAAGPMVVDVRYSVERINDVEYVTASAFQAGMRQAAQQGAAQGEQRTLRRLQQSPGTRKRVGM